jgi:hypothetical protein
VRSFAPKQTGGLEAVDAAFRDAARKRRAGGVALVVVAPA